jgi:tetratricopeptide (TPR) repeat protein
MSEPIQPQFDPDTLREVYADPEAVQARIVELRSEVRTAADETAELLARGELVALLRGLGELDDALTEGKRAADRAEMVGTRPQQHLARLRLAHVHQWRGEFAESNLIFTELLNASTQFGPVIEAFTHQHAGKNSYDQGHFADAREHFARALAIREQYELPDDQLASSKLALAAAERRLQQGEQDGTA